MSGLNKNVDINNCAGGEKLSQLYFARGLSRRWPASLGKACIYQSKGYTKVLFKFDLHSINILFEGKPLNLLI